MVYITGDTHGYYDQFLDRINDNAIPENSTIIVCGDFGFVWRRKVAEIALENLTNLPYEFLFIDGNHEDFDKLNTYPIVEKYGGKTHKISDNIHHLMRGQIFVIDGKSFFTMGGAYSVDKAFRREGESWFKDELPSNDDYNEAEKTLKKCNYKVDYVITHTIPAPFINHYLHKIPDMHDSELTGYFDWLYNTLDFKKWFAGHFHENNEIIKNRFYVLFDQVITIG